MGSLRGSGLVSALIAVSLGTVSSSQLNQTCYDLRTQEAIASTESLYYDLIDHDELHDARITSVNDDDHKVTLYSIWSNPRTGKYVTRHMTVDGENNMASVTQERDVSRVLFLDRHPETERSAEIFLDSKGEAYITVNTSASATSCTLRLSHHADHGDIVTDSVFGVFAFSGDGRKILYAAEAADAGNALTRFLYRPRSHPGEATRPRLFVFDVDESKISAVEDIPTGLVAGHVQWHPTSDALVGVVWEEMPEWPLSANQESNLFALKVAMESNWLLNTLLLGPQEWGMLPTPTTMIQKMQEWMKKNLKKKKIPKSVI